MTGIFRTILIISLVYLILRLIGSVAVRSARRSSYSKSSRQNKETKSGSSNQGVPKDIGEYIDYEEVNDDE